MNSDLWSALVALVIQLPIIIAAWWLMRNAGIKPSALLTRDEWAATAKLCVATGMLLFLLWRMIYSNLPQELFIYGRF